MLLENKVRLDKWLWYCRFYKSRTSASQHIKSGKFRVNGLKVKKAAMLLKQGDVIMFSHGSELKIVKVLDFGKQRGSLLQALDLYEDVTDKWLDDLN